MDSFDDENWSATSGATTFLSICALIFTTLTILSFPHLFNRYFALSLVLATTCLSWHFSDGFPDVFAQEQWLRSLVMFIAHVSHLLLFRASGKGMHSMLKDLRGGPWYRGYKLLFNVRGIGTNWELLNLHHNVSNRDKVETKGQGQQRSRRYASAILTRLFYLLVNYVVLCLYYDLLHPALYLLPQPADFAPHKESFLRRFLPSLIDPNMQASVTTREAWMRLCTVVELVIPEYFWLSAYHDLSAIIFIGLGLDQDDEWPPIMGLVSAAKTVRGFWGGFWHRILYRSFNAHAASLSHRLGFEKGTLAARMMNNFLVFMFSAVMHSAVSARIGNQCAWGRNMAFWLLQPLAFVMEGVVQALWRRYWSTVALSKRQLQLLHGAEAVAGYCWVLCWFFWVEPKRIFPLAYCGKE